MSLLMAGSLISNNYGLVSGLIMALYGHPHAYFSLVLQAVNGLETRLVRYLFVRATSQASGCKRSSIYFNRQLIPVLPVQ